MKKIYSKFIFICLLIASVNCNSQISLTNGSPTYTQNFDAMGASASASLPANWKMSPAGAAAPTWLAGGNFTAVNAQASSGAPTSGARYNWGTTAATDRSPGFMTSGSYASPNSIMSFFTNGGTTNITDITIAYDAERYRINTTAASIQFYYSLNGTAWIAVTAGNIAAASFPTGASSYTFGTPLTINKTGITITGLSIAPSSSFYLRWNLNTTGANSQGIGIDNASLTATFEVPCTPPTPTYTVEPSSPACTNTDLTYTTQPGKTNYTWSFPGVLNTNYTITSGGTSTDNTVTIKFLTGGSKTVTVGYTQTCASTTPASSTITVVTTATAIAPATTQNIPPGVNGNTLTVTEGTATVISRQWKYSTTAGGPYTNTVSGATNTTYTPNFPATGNYYVVCEVIYDTPCSTTVTSNEVPIIVANNTISLSPAGQSFGPFCNGTANSVSLDYNITGTITGAFIQLSNSSGSFASGTSNIGNSVSGSGPFTISGSIPSGQGAGSYRIRIVSNEATSADNGSNIIINATPEIPTSSTPAAVCTGNAVTITGSGSTGATTYSYWTASTDGTQYTTGNPAGYTVSGGNLTTPTSLAAGTYDFYVQGENGALCSGLNRQLVTITINPVPANPGNPVAAANPSCGATTLNTMTPPGGETYYWQGTSANGTSTANSTASTFVVSATNTYYVRSRSTAGCWSAGSGSLLVTINSPNITVSSTSINTGFNYDQGTTPPVQNFTVAGTCLTANLVVNGTANYEVSLDGTTFSSSVSIAPSSGTVATTTIYIRLKTTLTANSYNEIVTVTSTGATTRNITCSGTVYQPNNSCSGATTLTVNTGTTCTVSTTGSVRFTSQSIAPITCNTFTGNSDDDVWYKFTATSTTHYITAAPASTSTNTTTGFDIVVEVLSGMCGTQANVTCADDLSEGGTEIATATGLTIGTTYFVRVYEYKANSSTVPANASHTVCITSPPSPCSDLFISEYELGLGNNKVIEIYNPTNAAISLSGYNIKLYNNGSGTVSATINLTAASSIPAYGTWVIANNSASASILALANQTSSNINFDGNDAFGLYFNTTLIDVFGKIGEDPTTATGWVSGSNSTLDVTLIRMPNVQQGIIANPGSGFPTLSTEWIQYPISETSYLGSHYSNCDKTVILTGDIGPQTYCVTTTLSAAISVPFTTYGTFNAGNIFTAQLSNSSGSFATPVNIGTLSLSGTDVTGTINATIPANTSAGTNYKVRVTASAPESTLGIYASRTPVTIYLAPQNVTSASATAIASGTIQLGWINPGCFDEVLVISCATGPVATVPIGDGSNYNVVGVSACLSSSCEDVVYKGGGSTITVSGLDNGNTYYFKIWTRKGTEWSSGVAISGATSGTTIISAGDFALVGINSNNGACSSGTSGEDNIYFVCFKDITSGTTLDITDNGWEACNTGKFNNTEGFYRVTYTGSTIPAGTVIKWVLPGSGTPAALATGWAVTNLGTNNVNTNSNSSGGDQIFFLQGGVWYNGSGNGANNATYTNGRFLFAFNTKTTWSVSPDCSTTNGRTAYSKLPTDVACFSQTPSAGTVDYILYTGSTASTDKYTWIARLLSPANWTSSYGSCTAFNTAYITQFGSPSITIDNTNINTSWTGSANTNWYDCQNWNAKQIPDESVNVTIPNVANKPVVDYTAAYSDQYQDIAICKNITIESGSSVTIQGNASNYLEVFGDLTINSGAQLDADDGNAGTPDGTLKLYGNWLNNAGSTGFLEGQSKMIFGGAALQNVTISGGATTESFHNLTVAKKTQTSVKLNNAITTSATGKLEFLCGGYINANGNLVSVLNPSRLTSITGYDALNSTGVYTDDKYVYGSLERAINTTGLYDFPIGDITTGYGYNPVQLDISAGTGNATAKFITGDPGSCNTLGRKYFYCSGIQKFIEYNDMTGKGWWNFESSTATSFSYDIYLHPNTKNINDNPNENAAGGYSATYRALKGPTGTGGLDFTPYVLDGDPCIVSNTYYNIVGSGYSGFSDFAPGGGTNSTTPLPVELASFTGSCADGRAIRIQWSTLSEVNTKSFILQHSVDGVNFINIAEINAAGFSSQPVNYTFIDSFATGNINYYRLREIDFDNTLTIFPTIEVRCSNTEGTSIYYNQPKVIVELFSNMEKEMTFNIFDISGKLLHAENIQVVRGGNKFNLDLKKQLASGIYIVEYIDGKNLQSVKIWIH